MMSTPVKVGGYVRVNPTVTLPTKAQPSHVQGGNQDTISETHEPMSGDGEESLLLSRVTKSLYSFSRLPPAVTPNDSEEDEQAVESMVQAEGDLVSENLVDHDGHQAVENMMDSIVMMMLSMKVHQRHDLKHKQTLREICAGNYDTDNHPSTPPLPSLSSSEEEEGAADTKGNTDSSVTRRHREAKGKSHALANTSSEDEDGPTSDLSQCKDASSAEAGLLHFKPGQLPLEAIQKAQALGMCTTQEAQVIADEYGKTLGSIMAAAGLTTKATCAESVWNMDQAWYAHTNPKASAEETKDYYRCHTKHYEDHKDEDEHPQLWAEIWKYWSEYAQTWCNVEGIHVFGCVIYSGSDEAACQSQGIFAGSSLLMQLNTCLQLSSVKSLTLLLQCLFLTLMCCHSPVMTVHWD
ncbi:hypothetical protein F5J12DRAFT_779570 [Pisolithus orientalis]|uniref:uncharacterized protein n=1 Tax=Pisolithus orientalis TaxID=936130 RepID=UPI0022259135|nr:uncharacterized protein F5J12DRAFT_779570 [Pisolithus orientalis]KAI6030408.1 hypothetical protein F5J12DRAFT_779570 [Pisolithus orientalis]